MFVCKDCLPKQVNAVGELDGIAAILNGIAYEIECHYHTEGVIRDGNGNAIGTWTTEGTNE